MNEKCPNINDARTFFIIRVVYFPSLSLQWSVFDYPATRKD